MWWDWQSRPKIIAASLNEQWMHHWKNVLTNWNQLRAVLRRHCQNHYLNDARKMAKNQLYEEKKLYADCCSALAKEKERFDRMFKEICSDNDLTISKDWSVTKTKFLSAHTCPIWCLAFYYSKELGNVTLTTLCPFIIFIISLPTAIIFFS